MSCGGPECSPECCLGQTCLCIDAVMLQISFAHLCEAKHMGEFAKEEFCRGCDALAVATIEGLIGKLPQLRQRFDEDEVFDDMYNYVFTWACPKGKRYSADTEPYPTTGKVKWAKPTIHILTNSLLHLLTVFVVLVL